MNATCSSGQSLPPVAFPIASGLPRPRRSCGRESRPEEPTILCLAKMSSVQETLCSLAFAPNLEDSGWSLRVSPALSAPGAGEGSHGAWGEPERVDDTQVLETALGAGLAKKVLGNLEPSCRLRRSEPWLVCVYRKVDPRTRSERPRDRHAEGQKRD